MQPAGFRLAPRSGACTTSRRREFVHALRGDSVTDERSQRPSLADDDGLFEAEHAGRDPIPIAGKYGGDCLPFLDPVAGFDWNHESHRRIDRVLDGPSSTAQLQYSSPDAARLHLAYHSIAVGSMYFDFGCL